jgi:uncharacterized protein (DUF302 family)
MAADSSPGIINLASPWSVAETAQRLEAVFAAKKIKLFARIDQSAEAAAVGLKLRPTILLVFGDPAKGTPLMDSHPTLAVDLPLKALIWEVHPGQVTLSLTSPEFLRQRHQLPFAPFAEVVQLLTTVLANQKSPSP